MPRVHEVTIFSASKSTQDIVYLGIGAERVASGGTCSKVEKRSFWFRLAHVNVANRRLAQPRGHRERAFSLLPPLCSGTLVRLSCRCILPTPLVLKTLSGSRSFFSAEAKLLIFDVWARHFWQVLSNLADFSEQRRFLFSLRRTEITLPHRSWIYSRP